MHLKFTTDLQKDEPSSGVSLRPLLGIGAVLLEADDARSSHGEPIDIVDSIYIFVIKAHDIDGLLVRAGIAASRGYFQYVLKIMVVRSRFGAAFQKH